MEENLITNEAMRSIVDDNITDAQKRVITVAYHSQHKVGKHLNVITFGEVKELSYDPMTNTGSLQPVSSIDEFTFYYLFCTINNITAKHDIADTQLLVLSAILSRPLDFSLPIDSKDGKLTEIAKELSKDSKPRTPNAIYQSIKRLRDKGYLVETEDSLIVPNAMFQRVRQIIKGQIKKQGFATFDCLFKCFVE